MKYTDQNLLDALNKAKMTLMCDKSFGFMASLFFTLKFKWDTTKPTAWTDGISMGINPDFFMAQTEDVRISVLAHETWHVAYKHMTRASNQRLDPRKFNIAADYIINLMLKDNGFTIPEQWLCDNKYRGMSAEQVYNTLPTPPPHPEPQEGESGGSGEPTGDDLQSPTAESLDDGSGDEEGKGHGGDNGSKPNSPSQQEINQQVEAQIDNNILKAHAIAQMSSNGVGTMPGEIEVAIEDLLNPRLDWKTILQNYMTKFQKEDYSWSRPNLNYFHENIYLPGQHSEAVGEIACAVDTSGSVSDEEFQVFKSEINDIIEKLRPEVTTIIDFDTTIKGVHKLKAEDSIQDVKFTGRGGTYLKPVFDYYNKVKPEVLIVFSDLYCDQIQQDPGYPVIWVVVNNPDAEVKFGTVIHFDTTDL